MNDALRQLLEQLKKDLPELKEQLDAIAEVIGEKIQLETIVNDGVKLREQLEEIASTKFSSIEIFKEYLKDISKDYKEINTRHLAKFQKSLDEHVETINTVKTGWEEISSLYGKLSSKLKQQTNQANDFASALSTATIPIDQATDSMLSFNSRVIIAQANFANITDLILGGSDAARLMISDMKNLGEIIDNIGAPEFQIDGKSYKSAEAIAIASKNAAQSFQEMLVRQIKGEEVQNKSEKIIESLSSELEGMSDTNSKLYKEKQKQLINERKLYNFTQIGLNNVKEAIKANSKVLGLTEEQVKQYQDRLKNGVDAVDIEEELADKISKGADALKRMDFVAKGIENTTDSMVSQMDKWASYLPQGLRNFLGIDKSLNNIKNAGAKAAETFRDSLRSGEGLATALNNARKSLKGLNIEAVALKLTLIGIAKAIWDIVGVVKDLSKEQGVSLAQAEKLYKQQLDIQTSDENRLATLKDIAAVQQTYAEETGTALTTNKEMTGEIVTQLTNQAKYFGYSVEEATKLQTTLMMSAGATAEQASHLSATVGLMAEAAGISPRVVARDIVENAEMVATYFSGMPGKAAEAAIEARKLGMSLKQASSMADAFMDVESSLTNIAELQALGGPDLSMAQQYALMGDTKSMMEEVNRQIRSTAEFDGMNLYQKRKIAETLGMTVGELRKSLAIQESIANMSEAARSAYDKYGDRLGDITGMSNAEIKAKAEQLGLQDRFNASMDKFKNVLLKAIVPGMEIFADILDAAQPVLNGLLSIFKGIAAIISGLLIPFKIIGKILTLDIKGAADSVTSSFSSWKTPIDWIKNGLKLLGVYLGYRFLVKGPMKLLRIFKGLWKLLGKFKGGLGSLSKMFSGLGKLKGPRKLLSMFKGKGLGKSLTKTLSSAKGIVGGLATKVIGKVGAKAANFKGKGLGKRLTKTLSSAKGMVGGLATKAMGKVGGLATKAMGKVGTKAVGKSLLKKIPGVGAIIGLGFAASRLMKGDALGAIGEAASGLASIVPGIGTAASIAIDGALAARDVSKESKSAVEEVSTDTQKQQQLINQQVEQAGGMAQPIESPKDPMRLLIDSIVAMSQSIKELSESILQMANPTKIVDELKGIFTQNNLRTNTVEVTPGPPPPEETGINTGPAIRPGVETAPDTTAVNTPLQTTAYQAAEFTNQAQSNAQVGGGGNTFNRTDMLLEQMLRVLTVIAQKNPELKITNNEIDTLSKRIAMRNNN